MSVAVSVLRTELLSLKQDHGETILAFASKALGKARNCKLKVKCPQGHEADYSDDMVKQVILAGMYDDEIKRKVLSNTDLDKKSLNDTIKIIETEEKALRSMGGLATAPPDMAGSASHNKPFSSVNLLEKAKCQGCQTDFNKNRCEEGTW